MLVLNKYQKTKDGINVMPLVVSGDIVQCADTRGKIIMKNINDFSEEKETQEKEERIIEVSPTEEFNTDTIFDKNKEKIVSYNDEFFTEEGEIFEETGKDRDTKLGGKREKTPYISDEGYI